MDLLGTGPSGRIFIALPAVALGVGLALCLGGAVGFLLSGEDGDRRAPGAATAGVEPGCALALETAARALEAAGAVDRALDQHTELFSELVAGRATLRETERRASPVLTSGARESVRLDVARQQYESALRLCPS